MKVNERIYFTWVMIRGKPQMDGPFDFKTACRNKSFYDCHNILNCILKLAVDYDGNIVED